MKKISLLIICSFVLVMSSCFLRKDIDPYNGLSKNIQKIVPEAVLDSLQKKGLIINRGDAPPTLDFSIVASPFKLISPYGPDDSWTKGKIIQDYYFKFYDQTTNKEIKYDFQNNGSDYGTGVGSFISGEGNNFTIFSEVTGSVSDEDYKTLSVISGTLDPTGIRNFQYAFVITYKSLEENNSSLIPVNTGRVWIDGDFISEKHDYFGILFNIKKNDLKSYSALQLK
jgi:hypothetical protein